MKSKKKSEKAVIFSTRVHPSVLKVLKKKCKEEKKSYRYFIEKALSNIWSEIKCYTKQD